MKTSIRSLSPHSLVVFDRSHRLEKNVRILILNKPAPILTTQLDL